MTSNYWHNKQRKWQEERQLHFQDTNRLNTTTGLVKSPYSEPVDKVNYQLCHLTILDNQIKFSSFPDHAESIDLVQNTNYIFDVSDPSNLGHEFTISRIPSSGKVKDLTYQGKPGYPGSFVSLYIGDGRPQVLYYYDKTHKGIGGKINILPI